MLRKASSHGTFPHRDEDHSSSMVLLQLFGRVVSYFLSLEHLIAKVSRTDAYSGCSKTLSLQSGFRTGSQCSSCSQSSDHESVTLERTQEEAMTIEYWHNGPSQSLSKGGHSQLQSPISMDPAGFAAVLQSYCSPTHHS